MRNETKQPDQHEELHCKYPTNFLTFPETKHLEVLKMDRNLFSSSSNRWNTSQSEQ